MFAWAERHLERLGKTLAPTPTDTCSRFKSALIACDYDLAISLLSSAPSLMQESEKDYRLDPRNSIVNQLKASLPIHLAAEYGAIPVVCALINEHGISAEQLDSFGNSPLHYAAGSDHPSAFDLVKILVNDYKVSVTLKNSSGLTPYDLCKAHGIRQWLLPIQLQRETQQCLDMGGAGLPPGIDLGGLKLGQSFTTSPPPIVGPPSRCDIGPPPLTAAPQEYNRPLTGTSSVYVMPTFGTELNYAPPHQSYSNDHGNDFKVTNSIEYDRSYVKEETKFSDVRDKNQSNYSMIDVASNTSTTQPSGPLSSVGKVSIQDSTRALSNSVRSNLISAPADSCGVRTYARTGFSSAAFLPPTAKYRPDGFHSSSSDTMLQDKYGHDKSVTGALSGKYTSQADLKPPPVVSTSQSSCGLSGSSSYNPYACGAMLKKPLGNYVNGSLVPRSRYPNFSVSTNDTQPISNTAATYGEVNIQQQHFGDSLKCSVFNPNHMNVTYQRKDEHPQEDSNLSTDHAIDLKPNLKVNGQSTIAFARESYHVVISTASDKTLSEAEKIPPPILPNIPVHGYGDETDKYSVQPSSVKHSSQQLDTERSSQTFDQPMLRFVNGTNTPSEINANSNPRISSIALEDRSIRSSVVDIQGSDVGHFELPPLPMFDIPLSTE